MRLQRASARRRQTHHAGQHAAVALGLQPWLPAATTGTASDAAWRGNADQALPPTWQPAAALQPGPPAMMRAAVSRTPCNSAGSRAAARLTEPRISVADGVLADLRQRSAGAQHPMPQSSVGDAIGAAERRWTAVRPEGSVTPGLVPSRNPIFAGAELADQGSGARAAVSPAQAQYSATAMPCSPGAHDVGCNSGDAIPTPWCQVRLSCARTLHMLQPTLCQAACSRGWQCATTRPDSSWPVAIPTTAALLGWGCCFIRRATVNAVSATSFAQGVCSHNSVMGYADGCLPRAGDQLLCGALTTPRTAR